MLYIISHEKNILKENNIKENIILLIKIYSLLFDYLLNFNKDVLSIEYLNLSDIEIFDKENIIYKAVIAFLEMLKKN